MLNVFSWKRLRIGLFKWYMLTLYKFLNFPNYLIYSAYDPDISLGFTRISDSLWKSTYSLKIVHFKISKNSSIEACSLINLEK